jgi:hypothetical protein
MTFEEQNLAIAEFLGTHTVSREMASWNKPSVPEENIHVVTDKNGKRARYWTQTVLGGMYDIGYIHVLRYNEDLNAMHEAEKALNHDQLLRYHGTLLNMRGRSMYASMATAAQRAVAFLKAVGKLEE